MKYFEKEINGKMYQLRLLGSDIVDIEKKSGKQIQEYCGTPTYENCATLLRYMRKASEPQFAFSHALEFMDELIDNGFNLETIYTDIILPVCVFSGVYTQQDLNNLMEAITKKHNEISNS